MTQEKKIRRFYWVLAAAVLFTVLITWLILTLTQPVLTDSAIHVWTITQTPAEYQDKININTATIDELTYAEGIGPSTAKNIYDYLQQKGPVDSIDDLDSVPGIGEKRLEALKKIFMQVSLNDYHQRIFWIRLCFHHLESGYCFRPETVCHDELHYTSDFWE